MMRYAPSDKYTIAWFKLADCVAKGEKEKAVGVYRLLKHSFDDQAYAFQLEGDLLAAFQDGRAVEKYVQAAQLYMQTNRFEEAAVLYNDLIALSPADQRYVARLIEVYKKLKNHQSVAISLIKLADFLIAQDRPRDAMIVAQELQPFDQATAARLWVEIIVQVSRSKDPIEEYEQAIAAALECIMQPLHIQHLHALMASVEQTNIVWFEHLQKKLKHS